ncbi:MAG: family 16 glycosylhydrolase [Bacteroidia bacterium]
MFEENFDCKEDLPNLWAFNFGFTNDGNVTGNCGSDANWYGNSENAYNHNLSVSNGIAHLNVIQESTSADPSPDPNNPCGTHTYDFTAALLKSLNTFREGVFEARIKLPENPNMWPAFWLLGNNAAQEIDVFEFYDQDGGCLAYKDMRMTTHKRCGGVSDPKERGDKFPVESKFGGNFFNDFHIFKLYWTNYQLGIYVDGKLVGTSTRYYKGPYWPQATCHYNTDANDPSKEYSCLDMQTMNWPKKVDEDLTFPRNDVPMEMFINTNVKYDYKDNSMAGFSPTDMEVQVDWVKVYQPFNCVFPMSSCSMFDVDYQTGNTRFCSGNIVTLGNHTNNCNFLSEAPKASNGFHSPPVFLRASEEIGIYGGSGIEDGQYFEAVITDCDGLSERQQTSDLAQTEIDLFAGIDSMNFESDQFVMDSLLAYHPELIDSLNEAYEDSLYLPTSISGRFSMALLPTSELDNGLISIFPNPGSDVINIEMPDSEFADLYEMQITDRLGRKLASGKAKQINIRAWNNGIYYIKFVFSSGSIVVKPFIKQD